MNTPPKEPAAYLTGLPPDNLLTRLTPGMVSLSRVPMNGEFLEVSTPHWRLTTAIVDVLIEHDLIEICLADRRNFNVHDYRYSSHHLKPYAAFRTPVSGLILSCDNRGAWQVDGQGLEVVDHTSMYSFLSKIGTFAVRKQERT